MFQGAINRLSRLRWRQYGMIAWMPLLLAVLFVVQNHLFNQWSGLTLYFFIRRSISMLGTGVLLFGPAVLFPRGRRYLYLAASSLLVSLIFVAQYLYFGYSGSFLQASALKYASQTTALGSVIKTYAGPELGFFLVGLPVLGVGFWLVRESGPQYRLRLKEQLVAAGIILLVFLAGQGYLVKKEFEVWGNATRLYQNFFDHADVVRKMGVINYSMVDLLRQAFKKRGVTPQEVEMVKNWAGNREPLPNNRQAFGAAKGRNLILIQLESYESFLLGRSFDGQEITPNLNRLARNGLNLTNYYYHVGPGTTADAEFQIFNSLYAPMTETPFFEYPHHDYYALAEHLKNNGFRQAAVFHGDSKTFWNRTAIYPQLSIDNFTGIEGYQVQRQVVWGLSDKDFFSQSLPKIDQLPQPFFLTLMALTSHAPFNLPEDLRSLRISDKHGLSDYQIDYLQTARYVDEAVGELMEQLERAGLGKSSLFAIYGDHTAQIAPMHDQVFARWLGLEEFDEISYLNHSRGPMILYAPGSGLRGQISTPGTHVDLYPTVTNLLGLETPRSVLGHDLLNPPENQAAIRRRSSGELSSVLTKDLIYFSSDDGVFEHGRCLRVPDRSPVQTETCHAMYEESSLRVRISDIVLRGNLVNLLR